MRLIESYGTGIGKIIRLYSDEGKEPQFETAKGAFRVTLPNRNEDGPKARFAEPIDTLPENAAGAGWNEDEKERICRFAGKHGRITRKEAESLLKARPTRTYMLLKRLCREGRLRLEGSGKNSVYMPVK